MEAAFKNVCITFPYLKLPETNEWNGLSVSV